MLCHRSDSRIEAMCSRCLVASPIVDTPEELAALGWELRVDGLTWCLSCSREVRAPLGRPTQRGVVRRRR